MSILRVNVAFLKVDLYLYCHFYVTIPKVGKYVVLIAPILFTLSGRYKKCKRESADMGSQICDGEEGMWNGATKKCENVKVQCC